MHLYHGHTLDDRRPQYMAFEESIDAEGFGLSTAELKRQGPIYNSKRFHLIKHIHLIEMNHTGYQAYTAKEANKVSQ